MDRKIIIVTLPGEYNFGNRLQNYALQKVIQDYDYIVENIFVFPPVKVSGIYELKTHLKGILSIFGNKKFKIKYAKAQRMKKFLAFRDRYFENIRYVPREKIDSTDWSEYQFAVTGSDQVWHNWHKMPDELEYYYLEFIETEKRVSYAPSFGFTSFPEEDLESHRKGLMGIKALSCREQEGCKMIENLTGRKAEKVLDPTMLLVKEDWMEIEKKPDFPVREKYLLKFFIEGISEEYQAEVERISQERNLRIININDPLDLIHYSISPDEFVWLIHHADTVCTDSFHASVFSVIFETNLRVFKRIRYYKDMFGRLHDLLAPLNLLNVIYGYGTGLSTVLDVKAVEVFQREKEKSLQYLQSALK